jgi:hypothetical protein
MAGENYVPHDYGGMFQRGEIDLRDLIKAGFHQTSKKYRNIGLKWKAYKRHYESSISLTEAEFQEFHELSFEFYKWQRSRERRDGTVRGGRGI